MNNLSDEFILHFNILETDYRYTSSRKYEIISTIAEAYYNYTNSKLSFSNVEKEPLKNYVTYLSYKNEDKYYTLMEKNNNCYIEDILNSNKKIEIEQKKDDGEDDKLKIEINEKERKLGDNIIQLDEKNNYDLHAVPDRNPFSTILKRGAITYGVGMAASYGAIAAYLISGTAGSILGLTYLGGIACSGIGFIVAVPSLLGFGAYKLYRWNRDRYRQEFFKNFGDAKMKPEREVYLNAINKIENYFDKFISNNDYEISNIQKYINSILDIYINIENKRFNSTLQSIKDEKYQDEKIKELNKKMNYVVTITIKNISKITIELIKTITSSVNTDINLIFDEGIPYFKEFIKIFGPLNIDEENEKNIDENMTKIVQEMKKILKNKMEVGFNNFKSDLFVESFVAYLIKMHEEKQKYDVDMDQSTFISNCKEFLIEPIASKSIYFGVLSLYIKIIKLVQDIASSIKDTNYNNNKEKLNMKEDSKRSEVYKSSVIKENTPFGEEQEEIQRTNTQNIPNINEINFGFNMPCFPGNIQNVMPGNMQCMMPGNMQYMMPGNMQCMMPGNMQCMIPGNIQNINQIYPFMNNNYIQMNNQTPENFNNNLQIDENFSLTFIIIEKNEENKKIVIQVKNDFSIKSTINNFKIKYGNDIKYIKKYLIDDKIELDPSSEETLQEKEINEQTKIMAYKEKQ